MTHHEQQLKKAFSRTGLAFLGFTFEKAMQDKAIRIALGCLVKSSSTGKPAPVQPALI